MRALPYLGEGWGRRLVSYLGGDGVEWVPTKAWQGMEVGWVPYPTFVGIELGVGGPLPYFGGKKGRSPYFGWGGVEPPS